MQRFGTVFRARRWLLAALVLPTSTLPATMAAADADPAMAEEAALPAADRLLASLANEPRGLLSEMLQRNPDVARARAAAAAAAARAPQVGSLADPVAALTLFLLPPETRVGPQRFTVSVSQKLPWMGKLALAEQAALYGAAMARAEIEARRLAVLTDARRLLYELAFLDRHEAITEEEKQHLLRHEEAARARYSAGIGLQQAVIKIQAEITRVERQLLAIEEQRQVLRASLNALGDFLADTPVDSVASLPTPRRPELDLEALRGAARQGKPEVRRAMAEVARGRVLVDLAEKSKRPDFTVGLGYTFVDRRRDAPGQANPPPDDGDDILALSGAVNLPVRRGRLEAALAQALELQRHAEEGRRRVLAAIERDLGEHAARLPLLYRQWQLLANVLLAQAEEALRSAEAAYTTGKLGALDLLDAEHVLFEVRTTAVRTRTDYAIAQVRLEAAAATPLGELVEDTP